MKRVALLLVLIAGFAIAHSAESQNPMENNGQAEPALQSKSFDELVSAVESQKDPGEYCRGMLILYGSVIPAEKTARFREQLKLLGEEQKAGLIAGDVMLTFDVVTLDLTTYEKAVVLKHLVRELNNIKDSEMFRAGKEAAAHESQGTRDE